MSLDRGHAGIHLDGTHASVAIVHRRTAARGAGAGRGSSSGAALSTAGLELIQTVTGTSPIDALTKAAALVPAGTPVRVAVGARGCAGTTIPLTSVELERPGYTRTAREHLGLPNALVAGTLPVPHRIAAGELGSGFAVTAPTDLVADIYAALRRRGQVEVTTLPLCYAGDLPAPGVHLHIGYSVVDATLTGLDTDGRPLVVATRTLDCGAFDSLLASLHHDTARINAALAGTHAGGPADPLAVSSVRTWMTRILSETVAALDVWTLAGYAPGRDVSVTGPASNAWNLPLLMKDHHLRRVDHPAIAQLSRNDTNRGGLVAAQFGAYLAATSHGAHMPHAALPDPAARHHAATTPATGRLLDTIRRGPTSSRGHAEDLETLAAHLRAGAPAADAVAATYGADARRSAAAVTAVAQGRSLGDALSGTGLVPAEVAEPLNMATRSTRPTDVVALVADHLGRAEALGRTVRSQRRVLTTTLVSAAAAVAALAAATVSAAVSSSGSSVVSFRPLLLVLLIAAVAAPAAVMRHRWSVSAGAGRLRERFATATHADAAGLLASCGYTWDAALQAAAVVTSSVWPGVSTTIPPVVLADAATSADPSGSLRRWANTQCADSAGVEQALTRPWTRALSTAQLWAAGLSCGYAVAALVLR